MRSLFLVAGMGLATCLPAQAGKSEGNHDVAPPSAAGAKEKVERSVAQWIEQLGSDSFRLRVEAENALRDLGDKALSELKTAADESDDSEVQWRARRLVRQIERGDAAPQGLQRDPRRQDPQPGQLPKVQPPAPQAGGRQPGAAPDQFDDMQRRFDKMFGELERDFGIAVPRRSFFGDDFFKDITEQMEQLRQNGGGASVQHGMSMQIGADGAVHVEIEQQGDDGKSEKKVYDAPSLEEFNKQYPGVLQNQGLGGNGLPFRFWVGRGGQPGGAMPRLMPRVGQPQVDVPFVDVTPQTPVHVAVASGEVLGVQVRPEIGADLREHLGLADDQGLMVEAVTPDSLASTMGLQRGDIVLEVAGNAIGEPADVRKALAAVAPGKTVEVVCLRKGARTTLKAEKPAAVKLEKADEAGKSAGRLQKRERKDGETIR
ncbi:MAG: PDZ domain-containing protein [Planctomycetes bacterium]|nr:PDZ domain-containing protein [Planctomycetota bacterium]MCB9887084.1 PDZ domain-containing protein [Planctomycetota bacterium]